MIIGIMKGLRIGKTAGQSDVVSEMMKSSGDFGTRWMTDLIKRLVKDGYIPDELKNSTLVPMYKGR